MKKEFRVWCHRTKSWLHNEVTSTHVWSDYSIDIFNGKLYEYVTNDGEHFYKHKDDSEFTIQQFTGKYDIRNKPIYEGDIVELVLALQTDENGNKFGPEGQFGVYEVFYNERFAAYFLRVHRSNWLDTWFTTEKQAEKLTVDPMCPQLTCLERELGNFNITHIIGNTFETPELLKA